MKHTIHFQMSLQYLNQKNRLTFELSQHRFTMPAKRVIQENYPMTKLELDESKRKWKWGRYGIGKYVYTNEQQEDITRGH